jgi:hypothetical protein
MNEVELDTLWTLRHVLLPHLVSAQNIVKPRERTAALRLISACPQVFHRPACAQVQGLLGDLGRSFVRDADNFLGYSAAPRGVDRMFLWANNGMIGALQRGIEHGEYPNYSHIMSGLCCGRLELADAVFDWVIEAKREEPPNVYPLLGAVAACLEGLGGKFAHKAMSLGLSEEEWRDVLLRVIEKAIELQSLEGIDAVQKCCPATCKKWAEDFGCVGDALAFDVGFVYGATLGDEGSSLMNRILKTLSSESKK